MPLRFAVTKVSGQGEQITVDISAWNPVTGVREHQDVGEMAALLDQAMSFVDSRLLEMNMRMLEAYGLRAYFEPDAWMKIISIFDVLAGRQDITSVKQRWDDTIEENRELAEAREAAHLGECEACNERDGFHVVGCVYANGVNNNEQRCSVCCEKAGYHSSGCSNFGLQFEGQ